MAESERNSLDWAILEDVYYRKLGPVIINKIKTKMDMLATEINEAICLIPIPAAAPAPAAAPPSRRL